MSARKKVVIHRDRTFEYQGKRYQVLGAHISTGNSYDIADMEFNGVGDEDFRSIKELRRYLNEGLENGWPLGTPRTESEWSAKMNSTNE